MAEPLQLELDESVAALLNHALRLEEFFPEFTSEHARKLFPRSGLYGYEAESVVVRQGDAGHDLFIVVHGRVGVHKSDGANTLSVATLEPGAVIGEIALIRELPRTATVTALVAAKLFRLSYLDVRYVLDNNEQLAAHLKSLAAQRLGL